MQSGKLPRRRPAVLNSDAASAASSGRNGTGKPITLAAAEIAAAVIGPQRNSHQATLLTPTLSPLVIQWSKDRDSTVPGSSERIRKLVSRWIISEPPDRARRPAPPAGPIPIVRPARGS